MGMEIHFVQARPTTPNYMLDNEDEDAADSSFGGTSSSDETDSSGSGSSSSGPSSCERQNSNDEVDGSIIDPRSDHLSFLCNDFSVVVDTLDEWGIKYVESEFEDESVRQVSSRTPFPQNL